MQQPDDKRRPRRRRRPDDKPKQWGRYKLGVRFFNHQHPKDELYYYRSSPAQDRAGNGAASLERLVNVKWAGLVAWAGLYMDEQPIAEFQGSTNEWTDASHKQTNRTAADGRVGGEIEDDAPWDDGTL